MLLFSLAKPRSLLAAVSVRQYSAAIRTTLDWNLLEGTAYLKSEQNR
jgi:hypothetical protein